MALATAMHMPRYALGSAALMLGLGLAGLPRTARAADCPDAAPESVKEKRALAKEWFSRAEAFEASGDDVGAIKAYSCSFTIVPHAFTAYNLARAAERAGDLRLALTAHRDYLTLKPTAPDRAEIEDRIKSLEARLAATSARPTPSAAPPIPAPEPEPPRAAAPPAAVVERPAREPEGSAPLMSTAGWVIAGVGAASLAAGLVFNIGARKAMSDCRTLAKANNIPAARDACDRAKPFAYTSYVLFGLAGAAAITDVVLILGRRSPVESVALSPVPGGAALSAVGRF
jgi:hypothetical protein